jgi:GNAT superfamily N-acetyltransferase
VRDYDNASDAVGDSLHRMCSTYSVTETLRNARAVEIRALQPQDRNTFVAAANRIGAHSLYRRFFALKREFSEQEISFFVNVDFVSHVALVAVLSEDGQARIVGGGRYVIVNPGRAEVAFAVIDQYQGLGIGAALMRHLGILAKRARLHTLIAEVLPENIAMLKVFASSGYPINTRREAGVVHVALQLA